jgi:tetratricopeptide (TPR) repeat protein
LRLDPSLADARVTLGAIKAGQWDWRGAERECRLALQINPRLKRAYVACAIHLAITGRSEQALDVAAALQRQDPLNARLGCIYGELLYLTRRYGESIQPLRRSVQLGDDRARVWLAAAYDAQGLHRLAIAQYEKVVERLGDNPSNLIFLGAALARWGRLADARQLLERVKASADYVSPAELAVLYAGLGDREAALSALEHAYAAHDLQLQWLRVDQHYDGLRDEPRFRLLERRSVSPSDNLRARPRYNRRVSSADCPPAQERVRHRLGVTNARAEANSRTPRVTRT